MDASVRKDSVASSTTIDSLPVHEELSESKKRKASVTDVEVKRKAPTKGPAPPPPPVAATPVKEPAPSPPVVIVPDSVTSPVENDNRDIEEGISANKLDESDGVESPVVSKQTKLEEEKSTSLGFVETGQ